METIALNIQNAPLEHVSLTFVLIHITAILTQIHLENTDGGIDAKVSVVMIVPNVPHQRFGAWEVVALKI